jgi:hypothetical protein
MTDQMLLLVGMVVILLLLFAYWHPGSAALKYSVMVAFVIAGMVLFRHLA